MNSKKINYLHRILFYFPFGLLIIILGLVINYQSLMFVRRYTINNNLISIPCTFKIDNDKYYCVYDTKTTPNFKFKIDCSNYKDTLQDNDNIHYNIELKQIKNLILIIYLIGFTLLAIGIVLFLYHVRAIILYKKDKKRV